MIQSIFYNTLQYFRGIRAYHLINRIEDAVLKNDGFEDIKELTIAPTIKWNFGNARRNILVIV